MTMTAEHQVTTTEEWLRADSLVVDPTYQRPLSPRKVAKIVKEFDPEALGTIYVSRRGGGRVGGVETGADVILDGQHRVQAVVDYGWGDQKIPCLVYHGLTHEREAALWVVFNRDRTKPNPFNVHQAAAASGDESAREVDRILAEHGLALGTGPNRGIVQGVQTVYKIRELAGTRVLSQTLGVLAQAWGGEAASFQYNLLLGTAWLLKARAGAVDPARLTRVLSRTDPGAVAGRAKVLASALGDNSRGQMVLAVARELLNHYNHNLSVGRVPWAEPRSDRTFWDHIQ